MPAPLLLLVTMTTHALDPDFADDLQRIATAVLDRSSAPTSLKQACDALYERCHALSGVLDPNASALQSGRALSAAEAARCVQDFARTAAFVRAIDAALAQRIEARGEAQVLYAGCGPFAALVLPLLHRYSPQQLKLRLLDVHPHSLDSATALLQKAGVGDRLLPPLCADAATLSLPRGPAPDLLIVEVMQRALAREPQLQVLMNLLPQCAADAVLVPRCVQVSAALADIGREFDPGRTPLRVALGGLLELSADGLASLQSRLDPVRGYLSCAPLPVPIDAPGSLGLILRTRIEAGPLDVLGDYDSGLTHPAIAHALGPVPPGAILHARYRLGADPGFELELQTAAADRPERATGAASI
jgi:hypothetical protein